MSTESERHALVCCDASIAVRYLIDEDALNVIDLWNQWRAARTTIVAPQLLRYEVTNAIHRFAGHSQFSLEKIRQILHWARKLPIEIRDDSELHFRACALSRTFGLKAAYDAHYLALAEELQCPFYTSDAKLFRAVHSGFELIRLVD